MRYPEVRYLPTGRDRELELHVMDVTSRILEFESAAACKNALCPGRAERDAAAVLLGRLPAGCVGVSHITARPVADLLNELHEPQDTRPFADDEEDETRLAAARAAVRASGRLRDDPLR